MIELTLYFAIGFLSASLAAVVFIPASSRRAARLSDARERVHGQSGPTQATAQRVAHRGRSAIEVVRLEHQLALAQEQAARLLTEVGRASFILARARSEAEENAWALDDSTKQVGRLAAEMGELEAQLSSSQLVMHDLAAQRDRAVAAQRLIAGRAEELEAQASRDRAKIAILVTRSEHLEARVADLLRAPQLERQALERVHAKHSPSPETERAGVTNFTDRLEPEFDRGDWKAQKVMGVESSVLRFQRSTPGREGRLAASQSAHEDALVENARGLAERKLAKEKELELRLDATQSDREATQKDAARWSSDEAQDGAEIENALVLDSPKNRRIRQEFMTFGLVIRSLNAVAFEDGNDVDLRTSLNSFGHDVVRRYAARLS